MTGPQRRLRTISMVGSGTPKTAGGEEGECDRGSTTAIGPRTTGRGITASPLSDAAERGRDGCVKRRAVAGSPAPWRTCQKADVQRDGGMRSPTGCWVWETTGRGLMMAVGTFDVCSNAAVNSDLSCFLYTL